MADQSRQVDLGGNDLIIHNIFITDLKNAVDDAAAATAGVAVGQHYRNGSVLMVRVA